MGLPIWKDYYISVDAAQIYFCVYALNPTELIYNGKVDAKPEDTSLKIKINEICANYLSFHDINFDSVINQARLSRSFEVYTRSSPSENWHYIITLNFQNDWSYDYKYLNTRDGYQFPISMHVDPRQRILRTVESGYSVTAVVCFKDGSSFNVALPVNRSNDFDNDYNDDYSKSSMSGPGVAMIDLADYVNVKSVQIGGITWTVEESSCYRYALYYVNAHGGWDTLLCRGNGMEADNWKRHTFNKPYDNTVEQNRGTEDYLNEQAKRWTLRTGWLDDIGASRMHHLLGSTMAFIHDLQEDQILPVGVTTTDAPYKTYKNNGAKLVSYEFEVALQQERVRR